MVSERFIGGRARRRRLRGNDRDGCYRQVRGGFFNFYAVCCLLTIDRFHSLDLQGKEPRGMTSKPEQEAIAEFIRLKGVTRSPTVCAAPPQAKPAPTDLVELQKHVA